MAFRCITALSLDSNLVSLKLQIDNVRKRLLWQRNPTIRAAVAIPTTPLRFRIGGKDREFRRNKQEKTKKSAEKSQKQLAHRAYYGLLTIVITSVGKP